MHFKIFSTIDNIKPHVQFKGYEKCVRIAEQFMISKKLKIRAVAYGLK